MSNLRIELLFESEKHPKRLFLSGNKFLLKARGFPLRHHDTRRRLLRRVQDDIGVGLLQRRQFLIKTAKAQNENPKHQTRHKSETAHLHSPREKETGPMMYPVQNKNNNTRKRKRKRKNRGWRREKQLKRNGTEELTSESSIVV